VTNVPAHDAPHFEPPIPKQCGTFSDPTDSRKHFIVLTYYDEECGDASGVVDDSDFSFIFSSRGQVHSAVKQDFVIVNIELHRTGRRPVFKVCTTRWMPLELDTPTSLLPQTSTDQLTCQIRTLPVGEAYHDPRVKGESFLRPMQLRLSMNDVCCFGPNKLEGTSTLSCSLT
jgi:hypothetical protein